MDNSLLQAIVRCTVLAKDISGKNPQRGREAAGLMQRAENAKQALQAFLKFA